MPEATLSCHPDTPTAYVSGIVVSAIACAHDRLQLRYRLEGEVSRLRIPVARPSRHADMLWQHTCFEVFLQDNHAGRYSELNFSPSSEWAAYGFGAYREGMKAIRLEQAPSISVSRDAHRLTLEVMVESGMLLKDYPIRMAVSAVIEDCHGQVSYWALAHPPGKPDFHHRDGFVLSLEGSTA